MKVNFKRRPNSVFVDVELPKSVKQIQKAKVFVREWIDAAHEMMMDDIDENEFTHEEVIDTSQCRGYICSNRVPQPDGSQCFEATDSHCIEKSGCILRQARWNDKDRRWIEISKERFGEALCVLAGALVTLGWLVVL